jgi:hypothetical protein
VLAEMSHPVNPTQLRDMAETSRDRRSRAYREPSALSGFPAYRPAGARARMATAVCLSSG